MTDETAIPNLRLNKVRISFPRFFTKNPEINGEVVKPGGAFLVHPADNKAEVERCNAAIQSILDTKNKGKKLDPSKLFFRDGDLMDRVEYEGFWIVSANTRTPTSLPRVLTADKKIVHSEDQLPEFYPGILCNVLIEPWWQNNKHGKRVNAELLAVQVLKGGEPIAGGVVSEDVALAAFDDEGNEYGPGDDDLDF